MNALEATGVSHRYRRVQALRDCSLAVPPGRVVALVGPNGAGKTTLLHLAVGLLRPARGSVRIFGEPAASAQGRVAFMAQDKPLYDTFTVAETLRLGRHLNPGWDNDLAERRVTALDLPRGRRVSKLSGGQQAQVALTLAVAKRPRLLVLDEPLANLDPLARHDVMRDLMATVAETGLTVVLSSHVVADLTDTCDWLVVLNQGRIQVSGAIDDLLADHRSLSGPVELAGTVDGRFPVVESKSTARQATILARTGPAPLLDPRWTVRELGLEEMVLAYLRQPDQVALPRPTLALSTGPSA